MILARLRQVGTWFLLGVACAVGVVLALVVRMAFKRKDGEGDALEDVLDIVSGKVQLANARAAVEVTAARTKDAAVKAELRAVVQSDRSEAEKVRELVKLRERMGR